MNFSFPLIKHENREGPGILNGALSSRDIKKINDLANTLEPAPGTITNDGNVDKKYRSSDVRWLPYPYEDNNFGWIYDRVQEFCYEINDQFLHFDILGIGEKIQHGTYKKGDSYGWHMDVGPHNQSVRKFSLTILLDDPNDFKGGDLLFKLGRDETPVTLHKGDICFFPSYFLHKVTPVTKGIRRSLVVWVSGPPYK